LEYIVGEYGHYVEDIYNIPPIEKWANIGSQQDFGVAFKGLQSEASKDLG
jgi:hypothetical protein